MKKFNLLMLIIFFIIQILSCNKVKSKNNTKNIKKYSSISFKDQNGRTINLEKAAEKIVSMPVSGGVILIGLDQGINRLKGIHSFAKDVTMTDILGDFFPNIVNISTNIVTSGIPNVEELLRINPDLILGWGFTSSKKNMEKMEKVGLKVATFQWNVKKDMTIGWINIVGNAIGKKERANKFINWRNNLRKKLETVAKKIPEKDRPNALYFRNFKTKYTIQKLLNMKTLRIKNPSEENNEKSDWKPKTINAEQILKWNPEIILLNALEKLDDDVIPEDIYNNKLFNEINAVKNKRVYKFPKTGQGASIGGEGSHEDPLSWMWLSMILYPDYFNFDLRKEIRDWYKIMYGKVVTENQIDKILRIKIHQNSRNYEKFMKN